jgi:DNA-directed RNA polymerase subunit RPC12/RpoP
MSKRLHTGRLVLTPKDPYLVPDNPEAIFSELRKTGLIATPLEPHHGYLLGENFMQLVTFMGCSPSIRLEPDKTDEPFCHLLLAGPYPQPRLLSGKNTLPPRCDTCRKRLNDWQSNFHDLEQKGGAWQARCPHCGHHQDPATYDFRQSGGCGRFMLFIENIFPQEAIPSPSLLESLKRATDDAPWHYFFQQEEKPQSA